jgi:hypothetical protein
MKGRDHFEDLDIDDMMWNGLIRFRKGTSGGLLSTQKLQVLYSGKY